MPITSTSSSSASLTPAAMSCHGGVYTTSMPASRRKEATTRLPRSWPSRPILVTSTLGGCVVMMRCLDKDSGISDFLRVAQQSEKTARDTARGTPAALAEPVLAPVERAQEQQAEALAIGLRRQRQRRHQFREKPVLAVAAVYPARCRLG